MHWWRCVTLALVVPHCTPLTLTLTTCILTILHYNIRVCGSQYYEMVCKGKAEGMKVLQKNAATTSLERAFDVKSETLARVLPSSYTDARLKEHMPGLLYYQVIEAGMWRGGEEECTV